MEIKKLVPRKGKDCYRIDDSDDVVVMMNLGTMPSGKATTEDHGIIVFCTAGMAQFEYDGQVINIQKNDLFLFMAHSIGSNFMSSSDFNCRQIWFSRSAMWGINMYGVKSLSDLVYLKSHPLIHLSNDDVSLLENYFKLICKRLNDHSPVLYHDISRSLISTLLLEILSMLRRDRKGTSNTIDISTDKVMGGMTNEESRIISMHSHMLANKFIALVEQSDGRIRKVEVFAKQLNVTPKHLSTTLKNAMSRRPIEMIKFFTLKAIEQRLRFTDMTAQKIAYDLNFPNSSFFCKYVKEHLGVTPMEYRRKYQKNNQ